MDEQKRGKDAGDTAPKPSRDTKERERTPEQDAANANERADGGQAVKPEDLNSANDE